MYSRKNSSILPLISLSRPEELFAAFRQLQLMKLMKGAHQAHYMCIAYLYCVRLKVFQEAMEEHRVEEGTQSWSDLRRMNSLV